VSDITLFVPVKQYWKSLEQMIAICYRVGTPQEAEPYQHMLQAVYEYNQATGSAYYPVYMENIDVQPQQR